MSDKIYNWLSRRWSTEEKIIKSHDVKLALESETATEFLIVWSTYETDCFNKCCSVEKLRKFSKNKINLTPIEDIIKKFHERYIDKNCFKHLIHNDNYPEIITIKNKPYNKLSDSEKLLFICYVVYRYRNNIFHGNKPVHSWSIYTEQISMCIDVMIYLIDTIYPT